MDLLKVFDQTVHDIYLQLMSTLPERFILETVVYSVVVLVVQVSVALVVDLDLATLEEEALMVVVLFALEATTVVVVALVGMVVGQAMVVVQVVKAQTVHMVSVHSALDVAVATVNLVQRKITVVMVLLFLEIVFCCCSWIFTGIHVQGLFTEFMVLDAIDDEPWGPHGTIPAEVSQATKKFNECQMVMNVLWTRLGETGKDWRYVYKALIVIEYLIINGFERAVDDIVEQTFQISSLIGFEYVELNGKDVGINVRKKSETIVGLLNNKEKIEQVRNKVAATRGRYVRLSSTGMSSKSSLAAFGSNSF